MTNCKTYHTEESKFASIIETSMYSSHFSSLWKRMSLRSFLKLDFDIWRTSQDKHPLASLSARSKSLTFASKILERKLKLAVHMYEEER